MIASLENWKKQVLSLPEISSQDLLASKTAFVIIDMINGFLTEGILSSQNALSVLPAVEKLLKFFKTNQLPCVAFADCHEPDCIEFHSFPVHCLKNSSESEIAPSLQKIGGFQKICKNSTNGFFTPDFQNFLNQHSELEKIIISGVCTDICVMQFALSLKAFCNQNNKNLEIIIPVNTVETYDALNHNAELMQLMALQIMAQAGIKLISEVNYHE
ncbi:MAG: cysteine hydrolase [Oscillospiraceae bacterium]|nr:cysteine hydrolase [Oscillospiraceae bacterium]